MDVRVAVPDEHVTPRVLNAGLEMATRVNEELIRSGHAPTFDKAVRAGVRWKPEPPGAERFDHAARVIGRGWGDCDDLAPYRAASLRVTGEDPSAKAVVYKSGPGRWHAITERNSGRTHEDPSRTCGMRVRSGSFAAGIAPAVVGMMSTGRGVNGAVRPFVAVRRGTDGYLARVDMPIDGADDMAISCTQRGPSPSKALSGCMAGACLVGGASGFCAEDHLDKMWALHGLLKGAPAAEVARVCGVDATKDALLTLQDIAPALVQHLRDHWDDARRLREMIEQRAARRGAAAPFRESGAPRSDVTGVSASPDDAERFGHTRVQSPYAERFGHRGRTFVGGAATMSPYMDRFADRGRAFVSEQAAIVGAATSSPYLERFRHRGRAFVSEQGVGAATSSPYMDRYANRGRAFVSPEAADVGAGLGLPFKPTLSFSLGSARSHHPRRRGHRRARARSIVHGANFAQAFDRALGCTPAVEGFFDDLFKGASKIVSAVTHTASNVAHATQKAGTAWLKPLGDIAKTVIQGAQGVISLIPGIGTGFSAAIGAGLALLEGGSPLEIAVKASYGAIPIPLGVRSATDVVVDAALSLAHTKNLGDAAIAGVRKATIDRLPGFAQSIGGQVFDTLAHIVLGHTHKQPTHAVVTPAPQKGFPPKVAKLTSPAHYAAIAKVAVAQHPAPKPAPPPPRIVPIARPAQSAVLPTLLQVVTLFKPNVSAHRVLVPAGVKYR